VVEINSSVFWIVKRHNHSENRGIQDQGVLESDAVEFDKPVPTLRTKAAASILRTEDGTWRQPSPSVRLVPIKIHDFISW
jgi:hypothetical protein